MNEKWSAYMKKALTIGTPECAVFFGVCAMVLALLFLLLGFWETLLVAVLALAGAFLGGVKDKKAFIRDAANKLFPPKQTIPYRERNEEIAKAVKESHNSESNQD